MDKESGKKVEEVAENPAASGQPAESEPDVEPTDVVFGKLLQLLRTVQSGMQNIDASHGLSGSQVWALWQVSAQPGLRVTELAEAQHLHPSTASNLLDKLETHGLVRRERRDTDNRVVRLYLTDLGIELVKNIPGPMQGGLRRALQALPVTDMEGLLKGVTSVLALMSEAPR